MRLQAKYHSNTGLPVTSLVQGEPVKTDCDVCREQTQKMSLKVRLMSKNDVVDRALQLCGQLGSYSDGCKLEVLNNFDDIYSALTHLEPICDLSGICSDAFSSTPTTMTGNAGDIECEFCEKVVQHWIDQWKANSTQEEFKEVLESICKKLGQPDRISRCLHIVDDYYIPFFNYILNELDAHQACAALGLCSAAGPGFFQVDQSMPVSVLLPHDVDPEVKTIAMNSPSNQLVGGYFMPETAQEMIKPGCVLCEFVMYRLQEWLQDDHTQEDIQEGLHRVCMEAPDTLKDRCQGMVNVYGPAIVQLIIQDVDPKKVCTVLDICDHEKSPRTDDQVAAVDQQMSPWEAKREKDSNCDNCQYVLAIVMDTVTQRDNADEIRNLLDSVCSLLPASVSDKCENFINAYAEQVIQMIADNLTPDEICQALELCAAPPPQDNTCIVCKYVVKTVDRMFADEQDIEEIKEELEQACKVMYNQKLIKECQTFVDTYTHDIIEFIAKGATPKQVCEYLHLCPISTTSFEVAPKSALADTPKCTVCQYIVNTIDEAIEDPSDVEKVKEFLEGMCAHMPSEKFKAECKTFVDTYTAAILDLIAHGASPKDVCVEIGLCDADDDDVTDWDDESSEEDSSEEDSSEEQEDEIEERESSTCLLCEYAMSELDAAVEDKTNQQEVRQELDNICYHLSKSLAKECLKMVDASVEKIVQLFAQDYTPAKVCAAIKMCQQTDPQPLPDVSSNDISRFNPPPQNQLGSSGGATCTICELGMKFVEKKILNNRTMDMFFQVEHAVLMMCSYIPGKYGDECEEFVETYGDQIIKLVIEMELSPQEVCTELGLCDGTRAWDATPVGGRRCNFGPALWCASKFHMIQCGTAQFCSSRMGRDFN